MSKLDNILLGNSFKFMSAKDVSPELKQQIKELYYDIAADIFPDDENFKKFVQRVEQL